MKDEEKQKKHDADDVCSCGHHHDGECDCGCDDDISILTLTDEEGNSCDYYEIDVLEVDGAEYTIMQPVELDEDMAENEVLIYRNVYDEDGNFVSYDPVLDDAVGEKVVETYNQLVEEFDGDDEDEGLDDDGCGCGNDR